MLAFIPHSAFGIAFNDHPVTFTIYTPATPFCQDKNDRMVILVPWVFVGNSYMRSLHDQKTASNIQKLPIEIFSK